MGLASADVLGYNRPTIRVLLECCGSVMEDKVTIKIPRELYKRLGLMIASTGFSSVTEFIVFVMRTLASGGEIKYEEKLTAEEVRVIRDRLKKLGYLKED